METKRNHDLSEEELAQVRKAMEDFRNTPVVKAEEPEPPAEPPEKPIKKRKKWIAWVAVAAVMLAVAIVLVMWFNRYWLGPNPMAHRSNTVSVGNAVYIIGEDGDLYLYNPFEDEIKTIPEWNDLIFMDSNFSCVIGLRKNGTVMYLGNVAEECLQWKGLKAVAAGAGHVVGLQKNGTVVAVGPNGCGQCEVGDWEDIVGITAGYYFTAGLRRDGTVVITPLMPDAAIIGTVMSQAGYDALRTELQKTEQWTDVVAISADMYHIAGLKKDGSVVAAGANNAGQCNVEGWKNVVSIYVGNNMTVGVCADGSVLVAGEQKLFDETERSLTEEIRRLTSGKRVVSAYGTSVGIYVLCDDGKLYCIERVRNVSMNNVLWLKPIMYEVKLP